MWAEMKLWENKDVVSQTKDSLKSKENDFSTLSTSQQKERIQHQAEFIAKEIKAIDRNLSTEDFKAQLEALTKTDLFKEYNSNNKYIKQKEKDSEIKTIILDAGSIVLVINRFFELNATEQRELIERDFEYLNSSLKDAKEIIDDTDRIKREIDELRKKLTETDPTYEWHK